ncbi:MAG TPA: GNAT family protein [Blastocatellia bacterium]
MSKSKPSPQIEAIAPFPDEALPLLWLWMEEFRTSVADDFSAQTPHEFIAEQRELAQTRGTITYGIYRDLELGGFVQVIITSPVACQAHCVFKREFFGHQTTVPALNEVARQLFDAGIERITMTPLASNNAIKSLIKAIGAVEEGRLRGATRQNGEPVDLLIFGLLKSDWQAKQQTSTPAVKGD